MPLVSIPGKYNLQIKQGATFERTFTVKDANGVVVDLSSYSARAQIREHVDSSTTELEMTSGGGEITLGADGTVVLSVTATVTAALDYQNGVWDLELVNGADVTTILEGDATLIKEVTR